MAHEIEKRGEALPAVQGDLTPMNLIHELIARGGDMAQVETLSRLAVEWEERNARKAYNDAIARFHEMCPTIEATDKGTIKTKSGTTFSWLYTKLPKLARQVRPLLREVGLSFSWTTRVENVERGDGIITARCSLRHALGHAEFAESCCPTPDVSHSSDAHRWTKAESNAKRRSLMAVLGVTPEDEPDENSGQYVRPPVETISESDAATLISLADEVGADHAKYLAWLGVARFEDIPQTKWDRAVKGLEDKRRAK